MKKDFAFDKKFIVDVSILAFCITGLVSQYERFDTVRQIIFDLILIIDVIIVFVEPNFYIADNEGIAIYYFLFIRDYIKWDEISSFRVYEKNRGYKKDFYKYYLITTSTQQKKPSYMKNKITKSASVKKIIKKYWNERIKGDEDI